jgi:mono/diheme cytochrome c family protein
MGVMGISACTKKSEAPKEPLTGQALIDRGQAIYKSNCLACHNVDPAVDGVLGPAIKGSSLELLEAKVLRNVYPEGYKPKRESRAMQVFPGLKDEIPALHAYLQ